MRRFFRAAAFYPVSAMWAASSALAALVAARWVSLGVGFVVLTTIAIIAIQLSMFWEVKQVHVLVNSQHDALIDRVNQLVTALEMSGQDVPDSHDGTAK